MQVDDLPDTDVLRAMVALQEGAVMEGDQHIVRGIQRALNKCAQQRLDTQRGSFAYYIMAPCQSCVDASQIR